MRSETLILWGLFCKDNLSFLNNQILPEFDLLFLNVKKDKEENSLIFFSKP